MILRLYSQWRLRGFNTEIEVKNLFVCFRSRRLAFYSIQSKRYELRIQRHYHLLNSIHRHEARSNIDCKLSLCKPVYSIKRLAFFT